MKPTILKVTAAHIALGRPISYSYGPIAHALRDRCRAGVFVQVRNGVAFLCCDGRRWWIDLPLRALQFTLRTNARLPCTPIAFRIDLPADLLKPRFSGPRRIPAGIAKVSHGRDRQPATRHCNTGKAA